MASDLLRPGLELVFCGYNPSLTSGLSGHHYAHPGNRFWRVLFAAGITDRLYRPEEDELLLDLGIGFTNLASRPTRRADELTRAEIRAGAKALRAKATWGVQETPAFPGVTDVVVPSPSGLNRMRLEELVDHYRTLAPFLARAR
jgi:TDG/mug DNA glycosylase family protein